jgi:transcriptional regulator GlxA family with amidase domain
MPKPVDVLILAVPETAGSVLYGMVDVLSATGNIWQTLVRTDPEPVQFRTRVLTLHKKPFNCGNNIPVASDITLKEDPDADILILPELWLGPDEHLKGRYPELMDFIRRKHAEGTYIYSACSGAVMLAETGLLDGSVATSHWGYQDLFRMAYPQIKFQPEPNLCFADEEGRIVTAGGTTSWHDLMIHIISRHSSPGEALRITKVYLLKWHGEGQLPYASLIRNSPHSDSKVLEAEKWLESNFRESEAVGGLINFIDVPERTMKRRFKQATGQSLLERVQNLRVEEAKRQLETRRISIDDISATVGYEDSAFFRRLFKRLTGLTPSEYRKMFKQSELVSYAPKS